MRQTIRKSAPNSHRYMFLNNQIAGVTYPVSVDSTFLTDIFDLEKSYANDSVIMFRQKSHPLRKFHVTGTTIRLMMTISRRFNTEGTLTGCSIHRLYQLMTEEYEESCSKEQFYAEIYKFIDLGILSVSRSGIVDEWKLESFKRKTGRFILFSPLVFKKAFTDLPIAAQKLYLYMVFRNGERKEFFEYLHKDSGIYTLTHKSRPAQIRELMDSLTTLEPVEGEPLFLKSSVKKDEKDALGRWALRWELNPAYLIRHIEGSHYRNVPSPKVPYSKTVARLRHLFHYYNIGEVEHFDHGNVFLRLAQLLHNASLKTIKFAAVRIKEMLKNYGYQQPPDIVHALQIELQDRTFLAFMNVLQETGVHHYLGTGEGSDYNDARPLQFFRTLKDQFSISEFKAVCAKALPLLRERFGDQLNNEVLSTPRQWVRSGISSFHDIFYLEDFLIELKSEIKEKTLSA